MTAKLNKLRDSWRYAAEQRRKLAAECRKLGSIDDAIPLENAANAFHRCADELEWTIANAANPPLTP